jgi:hypothetical protein
MPHTVLLFLLAITGPAVAAGPPASSAKKPHSEYFQHYEGTTTCLSCHEKEARTFFHSQHYQWKGETPALVNSKGKLLGKMNTINDFCTAPAANWIGAVKNSRGEVITKGCSACHAGLGVKPSETLSRAQLENIDCLQCHAAGYQRDVFQEPGGSWRWRPILWKNQEGLDSVSKRISLPTRTTCLRCHAASGGGRNFKRGDLEYALVDTDRDYDVHMGKDGANMQCIDCHAGEDHRVRGRGADLAATDMPKKPLSCDTAECHGNAPHTVKALNRHAERVACESCHIPSFARTDPTDMARDWSKPKYNPEKDKYSATITLVKDVMPVYAWWNGLSAATLLGEPVRTLADGTVAMFVPQGDRSDPKARLFPFKLHKGKLPLLTGKDWVVPVNVEEFFADGKLDEAVKSAALATYGVRDARYTWKDTTRYMGIFHGVRPASKALACLDCHRPNGRFDWVGLGYASDPLDSRPSPAPPRSGALTK